MNLKLLSTFAVVTTVALLASSCGVFTGDGSFTTGPRESTGSLKATVTNSKSFNPNISHGQITQYKVTISGDDFSPPIEAWFDGTAESGTVDGVPVGENRTIRIDALNINGVVIRSGETTGVTIEPAEVAETEVAMESVPIFANLADDNVVPNTRLIIKVFSDPADPIEIEDEFSGSSSVLPDISTGGREISPDASGTAKLLPSLLAPGIHKFTAKNIRTELSSSVTVRLTDGTKIKAAPLYSGGSRSAKLGDTLVSVER